MEKKGIKYLIYIYITMLGLICNNKIFALDKQSIYKNKQLS